MNKTDITAYLQGMMHAAPLATTGNAAQDRAAQEYQNGTHAAYSMALVMIGRLPDATASADLMIYTVQHMATPDPRVHSGDYMRGWDDGINTVIRLIQTP